MILESLLELVETLKARIDEHGDQLRQSEWLTRYALIDPLLRELGWDTEAPGLVVPEYKSGSGSADYALLADGEPVMMVEAKKLGTQLRDSVLSQGINYCLMEGTNYFSVTDGQRWEVYETHKPVPIDEKRIVGFDLKNHEAAEVCLKALALWRQSVKPDLVAAAQQSVVTSLNENPPLPQQASAMDSSRTPLAMNNEHEWQSLAHIPRSPGVKPAEVMFPDGSRTQMRNWIDLLTETVSWLMVNKMLDASHCPIMSRMPYATNHIVHTQPVHSDGTPFVIYGEIKGLYIERKSVNAVSATRTVVKHVGQDPAQFSVRFS